MLTSALFGLRRLAKPLKYEDGMKILERDGYKCQYCGLDAKASFENSLIMSVDFIHPRALKGKNHPSNLVAACRPCNVIKGERVFADLYEAKEFVLERRAELKKQWQSTIALAKSASA
jgi:5-methylcytosine-specific restriction endonuclease McrA